MHNESVLWLLEQSESVSHFQFHGKELMPCFSLYALTSLIQQGMKVTAMLVL